MTMMLKKKEHQRQLSIYSVVVIVNIWKREERSVRFDLYSSCQVKRAVCAAHNDSTFESLKKLEFIDEIYPITRIIGLCAT